MIKKRTENTDMPIGNIKKVPDFLPPPESLVVPAQKTEKVTLFLTKESLIFFKREAKKNKTKYQKMIREVVDHYAKQF